jgi:hypothetical protein
MAIKILIIVCLALIVIGLLILLWSGYNLKKIDEDLRRLDIEGEYRTKSHEIIFRWRLLRLYHGCDDSDVENWYHELLKPFKQKRELFTHISDVWKNKTDYEMITEYIEDNKALMDKIEKEMIEEGSWPLGDELWEW